VVTAAFSPDGKRIVTASSDKTARLWDADGKPIGELQGHTDAVYSAAFSPDGKRIVNASEDNTARLWAIFANTQELVLHAKAAIPPLPDPFAAQGVLPAPRAAPVVHRAGEMALRHRRVETVAQ
jgi:WD40 repeat protein